MLVVMQEGASEAQIQGVIDRMVSMNFTVHRSTGVVHTVLGGVGPADQYEPADFEVLDDGKPQALTVFSAQLSSVRAIGDVNLLVAKPRSGETYWSVDWQRPTALVIGGEAEGAGAPIELQERPIDRDRAGVGA